jgi:transposase-like protein
MTKEQEINLLELLESSSNEEKCRAYLEGLRWPDGVRCPRCGSDKISRIKTRDQLDCDSCRYRFSVTAGTIFHDTHLPLWKWFVAVYFIVEAERNVSVTQIKRTIGVSYKTAWYLCHRIREALREVDTHLLMSMIEAAGTVFGGETEGKGRGYWGSETHVRTDADTEALSTSEWLAQPETGNRDTERQTGKHQEKGWGAEGEGDASSMDYIWSLSQSGIGIAHQLSDKHLNALLNVLTFYLKRHENPYMFRDAMCKLLVASNLPYKELAGKRKG